MTATLLPRIVIALDKILAIGIVAAFIASIIAATPARAAEVCLPWTDLAKRLHEQFDEAPAALGVADNGGLMQLYTSRDGQTWTIVYVSPSGRGCLVASGETWVTLPIQLAGQPL